MTGSYAKQSASMEPSPLKSPSFKLFVVRVLPIPAIAPDQTLPERGTLDLSFDYPVCDGTPSVETLNALSINLKLSNCGDVAGAVTILALIQ